MWRNLRVVRFQYAASEYATILLDYFNSYTTMWTINHECHIYFHYIIFIADFSPKPWVGQLILDFEPGLAHFALHLDPDLT